MSVGDAPACSLPAFLQGFVSNKTSVLGDARVDPVETLMYAVFVASSERLRVADLAKILGVDLGELQVNKTGRRQGRFLTVVNEWENSCVGRRTEISERSWTLTEGAAQG